VLTVSFGSDNTLDVALNVLALRPDNKDLGVAVVDLTGLTSPDTTAVPALGGWNLVQRTTVGSTSKLAIMLAAFELRRLVKAAHVSRPADPLSDVTDALVKDWTAASDRESRECGKRPPNFDRIFDGVSFDFAPAVKTTGELHVIDEQPTRGVEPLRLARAQVAALSFRDRLRLMLEWSENIASSMCARDLGFAFISATLLQNGLFLPGTKGQAGKGGLWVGAEYGVGAGAAYASPALHGRRDPVGGRIHSGTARSIATLMTALALGRLDGSDEMLAMLKKRGSQEARSFVLEGIEPRITSTATLSLWSKIGIVTSPDVLSDAVIVEQHSGAVTFKYVVVIVNSTGEENLERLEAVAGDIHDVMQARYP
jgi:hypothetical protein